MKISIDDIITFLFDEAEKSQTVLPSERQKIFDTAVLIKRDQDYYKRIYEDLG